MYSQILKIRGHHLADIAYFLYNPKKTQQEYIDKGYGEEFVRNQSQIFQDFIDGKIKIEITAGDLDDICLANCQNREKADIPCNDPRGLKIDSRSAGHFLLEVGKIYTFGEIEKNLRNFYLDQHSM